MASAGLNSEAQYRAKCKVKRVEIVKVKGTESAKVARQQNKTTATFIFLLQATFMHFLFDSKHNM